MNRKLLQLLIALLLFAPMAAISQPVAIKCTEVLPDGDVLLTWNPLIIGSGFYNYTIYFSYDREGAYNLLAVITAVAQDNYLHDGAGANNIPVYYYLTSTTEAGVSPPSDTLATMLLAASTIDGESIALNWTPLHTPLLPDMHPWYLLYREYPPGNWAVVDSTQDLYVSHHFWSCNGSSDTVKFRIGVRNNSIDCTSFSNQKGEVLKNRSNRFPPVIDSVSINADGKVVIGWQPGSEPDIVGYTIFSVTSTNDSIDYVEGRFTTSYLHQTSGPCNGSLSYILLSIDSCNNKSPFPFDPVTLLDKPHATIYLEDIKYDPCLMSNSLSWTEYKNFDPPLEYTRIYVSENDGPFGFFATVSPGVSTFKHFNLNPNTKYEYFVRAYSQDLTKTSTSCRKQVTTYNSPKPLFMYTRFVTVENNDRVNLMFYTDTNAHVQYYRVLRSTDAGGPFTESGLIQNEGQEFISFTDYEADVTAESYYYQIEVIDSCGVPSIIANMARTIFLETEALPDLSNRLSWNAYESWNGQTQGYRIYRRLNNSSLDLLAEVGPLTLTYTDNVADLTGSVSRIDYLVEAYEGASNSYGFREQSYSNEVMSEQEPKVYLPNVIMPRGLNNQLRPVIVFVGSDGYEFVIYDRWGQMIFRTSDPGESWNGTFNGEYVPQGVYVYLLLFRNALNQPRQIKGNVAVIY
jgi:gliding motility-associated-like protein